MKTEYEVKVLNINVDNIIERLESLGAIKKGEYFQRRYVYNFNPKIEGKWIRLRSNGEVTTLTIKDSQENSISGTKELEIIVEDFDKMNLKDLSVSLDLGAKHTSYKMICALYNGDRLVDMKVYDKNLIVGNTSVNQSVEFDRATSDCDRLQVMIVKDFGTITPLCEAYIKN